MGDRGNVSIKQSNGQKLWVYTHWSGSDLPKLVQDGLKFANGGRHGQSRWNDQPYFNRCIISAVIGEKHLHDNTGYGVDVECGDGADQVVEIDLPEKRVSFRDQTWSFEEYVALASPSFRMGEAEGE